MSEMSLLPDLKPVEPPKYDDRWHFVEVSCEYMDVVFVCTAPEGAACRSLPLCQHAGGRCEDYEGGHADACTDRTPVDTGGCITAEWIDNSDETGRGVMRVPVATEWGGDFWIWKPRGDVEVKP